MLTGSGFLLVSDGFLVRCALLATLYLPVRQGIGQFRTCRTTAQLDDGAVTPA